MRRAAGLVAVLATVTAGALSSAPAEAARVKPTAEVISVSRVYVDNGTPMVAGTYRCTGRLSHLWVSAKQGRGDLTQEGSGAKARAWYQRTWDNKINCDGKAHTALFRMDRTEGSGRIRPAHRAYVQFCLLTANRRASLNPEKGAFDSNMRYRQIDVL